MCGIVGFYGNKIIEKSAINNALDSIAHRGPDGCGTFEKIIDNKNLFFGHRRLAILDLDIRSKQPFVFENTVLIFNGEIYNYIEVKKELTKLGHLFLTSGDTEILSHALFEWGISGLSKLEGMWSFAWYDGRSKKIILCRDRFGEKPLHIWERPEGIYFGSEVKALASLAGQWPELNIKHLNRYLVNGYKSLYKTKETYYKGVYEPEPGTYVEVTGKEASKPICYWNKKIHVDKSLSYENAVEETRARLIEAVRLRLRSDVPLAFCMSGGIDSNALIGIASKTLGYDVHGYTIENSDSRYAESDLVRKSANALGIRQTSIELSHLDFLKNLKNLVIKHDAPVATISYYIHWQLMGAVQRDGYKISISGTGADELFTGYYDHHNLYLYEIRNNISLHRESKNNWETYLSDVVRNPFLKDPDLYIQDPSFRGHIYLDNDKFSQWLKYPWREDFAEADFDQSLLRNRMMNELFVEGTRVILHEDDLNAMSYSIENRSPFLDKNLYEFAYSIPVEHLIRHGRAKAILRDAMRGIVPQEVLDNRVKVGFNAPIEDLLDLKDAKVIEQIMVSSPIFDIFDRSKIENLMRKKEFPNSISKFIFNFLNAKYFLELH